MKRLIAFSSVAHMGFVMLGIATLTDVRHQRRDLRHGRARPHHRHAVLHRRLGAGRYGTREIEPPRRPAHAGAEDGLDPRLLRDGVARPARSRRLLGRVPGDPVGVTTRRAGLSASALVPHATWWSPRSAPCSPPATCSGCSSGSRSASRRPSSRDAHIHDVHVHRVDRVGADARRSSWCSASTRTCIFQVTDPAVTHDRRHRRDRELIVLAAVTP